MSIHNTLTAITLELSKTLKGSKKMTPINMIMIINYTQSKLCCLYYKPEIKT